MALSADTLDRLAILIELLPEVTASLQGRADYGRNAGAQDLADRLMGFELELKTLLATPSAPRGAVEHMARRMRSHILPPTRALIDRNAKMMTMGPLNLSRTIEPRAAKRQNMLLRSLFQQAQDLVALLRGGKDAKLPQPEPLPITPDPIKPEPVEPKPKKPSAPKLPLRDKLNDMIYEVTEARLARMVEGAAKSIGVGKDEE